MDQLVAEYSGRACDSDTGLPIRDENAGLNPELYLRPKKDEAASLEAGRPIFREIPYIRIQIPGDRGNVIDRPLVENDKQRFPAQWKRFETGQQAATTGTPLELWPQVTRSQVEELRYWGIKSVEDLAAVSDGNISNIGPYSELRQKARDFISAAKGLAPTEQLRSELAQRDNEIEVLKRALKEQGDRLDAIAPKGKR